MKPFVSVAEPHDDILGEELTLDTFAGRGTRGVPEPRCLLGEDLHYQGPQEHNGNREKEA